MEEFFEIMDVKEEFLKNVGPQYQASYSPQQLDIAMYMVNDFCNNIAANGLVLLRMPEPRQALPQPLQGYYPQQQYPQQPQPVYQEPYPQPPYARQVQQEVQQMPPPRMVARPMPQNTMPMQNPFNDEERYDVQRQVAEMNRGIQPKRTMPQPYMVPAQTVQSDVDLQVEKPKTFVDKIKDMRAPRKVDKINPEE